MSKSPHHKIPKKLDIPNWFKNELYSSSKNLTPNQWYLLLDLRITTINQLIYVPETIEFVQRIYINPLRENPLNYQLVDNWPWFDEPEKKHQRLNPGNKASVIPVYNDSHDKINQIDTISLQNKLHAKHDERAILFDYYYGLDIDISAPDQVIKNDFENWLKEVRKIRKERLKGFGLTRNSGGDPSFSSIKEEINRLIEYCVLEYLDLRIYTMEEQLKQSSNSILRVDELDNILNESNIANIIFPQFDAPTARYRSKDVTRRIVRQITNNAFDSNPSYGNPYMERFKSLL